MKKVGILTTFNDLKPSYSLATVVKNQLQVFKENGYETVLLVLPSFNDDENVPKGVEVRKVIPQIILEPYAGMKKGLLKDKVENDVEAVFEALVKHCRDLDIIITHDWLLVDTYAPYAAALHLTDKDRILSKKKWLHWIHSYPSNFTNVEYPWSEQFHIPKNHKLVYLNNHDSLAVAERYQATIDDVRVVHNPTDPRTHYRLHPLVEKMIKKYDLLDCDIMQVYPVSTPRMGADGKQLNRVIQVFSELKKNGKKVKLVVCNAHANAQKEKDLILEMLMYAGSVGLSQDEVIFTSLIDLPEWEHGVPHEVVRDLFLLSNLFVFPTLSENCPLILLEAAAAKNLLVLNDDFPPLREFFGKDALYFKFSSLRMRTTYEDEGKYFSDVAKIIIGELSKNRPLSAFNTWKQKFNYDYIFKSQLEPILNEEGEIDGIPEESRNED